MGRAFVVREVVPCAEQDGLVQIEGVLFSVSLDRARDRLGEMGYRVVEMADRGALLARRDRGLLILRGDGTFSMSRVDSVESAISEIANLAETVASESR
jgi:hypothetical protein